MGDEEEDDEVEDEERRPVFVRNLPKGPSEEEMRKHRATHYPFRSWCPWCVAGRAKNWPHRRAQSSEEGEFPEICFDYAFPRKERGGTSVPVLVGRERRSKALIAHVVPYKGAGPEWLVEQIIRDLRKLGVHGKVILKGDQENALVDVLNAVSRARGRDTQGGELTVVEMSPKGESQSNGAAERAVQEIEEGLRTHILDLESKLKAEVEIDSPITSWMVENYADIVNKQAVGRDGKTPYERIKGKRYHGEFCEFGSQILHRVPEKPQGGLMAPRWLPGTWLGKRWSSDEHLVALQNGSVVRTRSVRARPAEDAWNADRIQDIKGQPWDPAGTLTFEKVIAGNPYRAPDVKPVPKEDEYPSTIPRGFRITEKEIARAGYTPGCPKCRDMHDDVLNIASRHNARCRKRVEEFLKGDEEFEEIKRRVEERVSRYQEEQTHQGVETRPADAASEPSGTNDPFLKPSSSESSSQSQPQHQPPQSSKREHQPLSEEPFPKRQNTAQSPLDANAAAPQRKRKFEHDHEPHWQRNCGRPVDAVSRPVASESEDETRNPWQRNCGRPLDAVSRPVAGGEADLHAFQNNCSSSRLMGKESWYDVAEIFSPPRTTARAARHGLTRGWSLDLDHMCPVTGRKWDLTDVTDIRRAWGLLRRSRPKLLIASPPCTLFSTLQNLTGGVQDGPKYREAVAMVELAVEMCIEQCRNKRYFIFEHPRSATSWRLPCLQRLASLPGMRYSDFDMCCFGMTQPQHGIETPVRKPTRIFTNSSAIDGLVARRCEGGHAHVPLLGGGRAKLAAKYPDLLCDSFLSGLRMELDMSVMNLENFESMGDPHEEREFWESVVAVDDVSGKNLDPALVRAARAEEMEGFRKHEVYEYVSRSEAESDPDGKFIGVRWIDLNKGTDESPNIRSRLVGQEYATKEKRNDLYAPTPPLAAARWILSQCASSGRRGAKDMRVEILDIKKAFLYGRLKRTVYIELPAEDPMSKGGQYVGRLWKAMYGTRDAPSIWQEELEATMLSLGFRASKSTPCLYFHPRNRIRVVAHVDDLMVVGPKSLVAEFRHDLSKKYELKFVTLGPEENEEKEAKFLGRTVAWKSHGLSWSGGTQLVDELIREWGLQEANTIETPGVVEKEDPSANADDHMTPEKAKQYRSSAAKLNYISLDHPKVAFACKEVSRTMSNPYVGDEAKLKRIIRFLKKEPVFVYDYPWQEQPPELTGFTDSDWAGCRRSRKSTSGGMIFHGTHLVHQWSRTQSCIALSSGEAELNAALMMGTEILGLQQTLKEMGLDIPVHVFGDSAPVVGILARKGTGRIKHLELRQLWLQEKTREGALTFTKIPRAHNVSDALTHHWTVAEGKAHFGSFGRQLQPRRT